MNSRGIGLALGAFALGAVGCTFHHVRDEGPHRLSLGGEPATVTVEKAPARRGGQRILVSVEHGSALDLEGAVGSQVVLTTGDSAGGQMGGGLVTGGLESCQRLSLERYRTAPERRLSKVLFLCRFPLTQEVFMQVGAERVPVLERGGLEVMGERPWLVSGWARPELGVRVTGVPATRGIDMGMNFGGRALLLSHLGLGGRADVLIDTGRGRGQFLVGPEVGFVHATLPCSRCSVEANVSYLVGYDRGAAHGPQADLRFGVRIGRTGTNWHGIDAGVGYRHLFGPESGGSLIFTLSYHVQTALRWGFLPSSIRAQPRELPPVSQTADSTEAEGRDG
jgi:hypothetical protein